MQKFGFFVFLVTVSVPIIAQATWELAPAQSDVSNLHEKSVLVLQKSLTFPKDRREITVESLVSSRKEAGEEANHLFTLTRRLRKMTCRWKSSEPGTQILEFPAKTEFRLILLSKTLSGFKIGLHSGTSSLRGACEVTENLVKTTGCHQCAISSDECGTPKGVEPRVEDVNSVFWTWIWRK